MLIAVLVFFLKVTINSKGCCCYFISAQYDYIKFLCFEDLECSKGKGWALTIHK